ncbi:migration and invasion enhancer 1 [Leptopilina heterotoma]|uniref:migration and invasion enhancer 1 n=1 Tax=Leptopilina heterotoma TaxID=63436 RepID=UPI001CA9FB34|nr:migration and invasion enhancer 1 [Leptopilina heterotoma]
MDVNVNVEYCIVCGYEKEFLDMTKAIKSFVPDAVVTGNDGKEGAFEVSINEQLVHSKLQTLAFPDHSNVGEIVREVSEGNPVRKVDKQQPIECSIQ